MHLDEAGKHEALAVLQQVWERYTSMDRESMTTEEEARLTRCALEPLYLLQVRAGMLAFSGVCPQGQVTYSRR